MVNQYITDLRNVCELGKRGVAIKNDLLNNVYNITRIAIETYDFPFTKGTGNQDFVLKAYSDEMYDLLTQVV